MNRKHIFISMLASAMCTFLVSIISFMVTPIVTGSVGIEAYGYVTLAKNFTSYANILMTALNSYAARYISVSYHKKEKEKFNKYVNTVLFADIFISAIVCLIGLIVVVYLENIIQIPPDLINDVKILFFLTFVGFFLSTCTTVFAATAFVKDKLDVYNGIRILGYFVEILILIYCFKSFNPKVWYVSLASVATASITLLGSILMMRRYLPEVEITRKYYSKDAFNTLVKNGIWNSFNSLGNTLNSGLDLLITNIMLTATGMGQISIAKTISNVVFQLYSVIAQPFQPQLLKKYSESRKMELIHTLISSMSVCGLATNVVFAGFVAIGVQFYKLWIPTEDILQIYKFTVIALLPCLTEGCVYPLYYIYTLTVKNKVPCIITIIGGLLNVISMYLLIKYSDLGPYAVLITTAVIMNIINFITNPLYMCKCLGIRKRTFYPQILKNLISATVAVFAMYFFVKILPPATNWGILAIDIFLLSLVGAVVQFPIQFKHEMIVKGWRKALEMVRKK